MNFGIMRKKGIKGTEGWRKYISADNKEQMKKDIRANGYTVIRIFSEKEVNLIKNMTEFEKIIQKKYTDDEINFVCEVF